jgi:hypothetical protein
MQRPAAYDSALSWLHPKLSLGHTCTDAPRRLFMSALCHALTCQQGPENPVTQADGLTTLQTRVRAVIAVEKCESTLLLQVCVFIVGYK